MYENMDYFQGIAEGIGRIIKWVCITFVLGVCVAVAMVLHKFDVSPGMTIAGLVGAVMVGALALMVFAGLVAMLTLLGRGVSKSPFVRTRTEQDLVSLAADYVRMRARVERFVADGPDDDFQPRDSIKACHMIHRRVQMRSHQHVLASEISYGLAALVQAIQTCDEAFLLRAPTWEQISELAHDYCQYDPQGSMKA